MSKELSDEEKSARIQEVEDLLKENENLLIRNNLNHFFIIMEDQTSDLNYRYKLYKNHIENLKKQYKEEKNFLDFIDEENLNELNNLFQKLSDII